MVIMAIGGSPEPYLRTAYKYTGDFSEPHLRDRTSEPHLRDLEIFEHAKTQHAGRI